MVNEPFAVINADDFYGRESFEIASKYLDKIKNSRDKVGLLSYKIKNTLSDNGGVTRGVVVSKDNETVFEINETSNIIKKDNRPFVELENRFLDEETPVSMNFWCFHQKMFESLEKAFPEFLSSLEEGDIKTEFLIPIEIDKLLKAKKVTVELLTTDEKWFGVTYREDTETVKSNIKKLVENGEYPNSLF